MQPIVIFDYRHMLRQREYEEYLQSPHWKAFRRKIYRKFPECVYCGASEDLNIAHLTYKNRGHEREDDVCVLCNFHHFQMDRGELSKAEVIRRRDAYKKN